MEGQSKRVGAASLGADQGLGFQVFSAPRLNGRGVDDGNVIDLTTSSHHITQSVEGRPAGLLHQLQIFLALLYIGAHKESEQRGWVQQILGQRSISPAGFPNGTEKGNE